jgi:hypothetical protein
MKEQSIYATIESCAVKSDCGDHRFILSRIWDKKLPINAFLCANPSKADELRYDATVFKCQNMAVNWGWGGFHVLNLYPNYSTDPKAFKPDPEADRLNAEHVKRVSREVEKLVIACGNGHMHRLIEFIRDIPREKLFCLRRNKGNGFLHPSRVDPDDFPREIPAYAAGTAFQ